MQINNHATRALTALLLGTSCVAAQTIVIGESDYVGDFTGVAIGGSSDISGSQIGDGWVANQTGWTVNASNEAARDTGAAFQPRGLAIAFAPPDRL